MILNILQTYDKSFKENICTISTAMLNMKATHLFLASNAWETVYIELDDSILPGTLRHLHKNVTRGISVKLPSVVTDKTINLLTELYPDKAGALRRAFMQGKDVREVLLECLVQ